MAEKKKILSRAAAKAAPEKPRGGDDRTSTRTRIRTRVREWGGWIKRQSSAVWKWLKRQDKLVFFNIILLALVIVMLCVMMRNVRRQSSPQVLRTPPSQAVRNAPRAGVAEQRLLPNRPTIIISRKAQAPIRRERKVIKRQRPVVPEPVVINKIRGTIIIDGKGRAVKPLKPDTEIGGNLILQNIGVYLLPCGIKIGGDLLLRNVRELKFCGAFDIAGNIRVSRNSSFGALPKGAKLGGQILF